MGYVRCLCIFSVPSTENLTLNASDVCDIYHIAYEITVPFG